MRLVPQLSSQTDRFCKMHSLTYQSDREDPDATLLASLPEEGEEEELMENPDYIEGMEIEGEDPPQRWVKQSQVSPRQSHRVPLPLRRLEKLTRSTLDSRYLPRVCQQRRPGRLVPMRMRLLSRTRSPAHLLVRTPLTYAGIARPRPSRQKMTRSVSKAVQGTCLWMLTALGFRSSHKKIAAEQTPNPSTVSEAGSSQVATAVQAEVRPFSQSSGERN